MIPARRFWDEWELWLLRELYPMVASSRIARALGRGIYGVYGMANKMGLQKSPEFLASAEAGGFRKGQKSWRTFPVGHIGPDPDGFLRIKIREPLYPTEPFTNYRPLYAWRVWEQHRGPVPRGHIIRYRDRNRANCAFENLELVSKKENRRRNSIWAMYPPELASAIALNGALKRQLRRQNAEKE